MPMQLNPILFKVYAFSNEGLLGFVGRRRTLKSITQRASKAPCIVEDTLHYHRDPQYDSR